MVKEKRLPVPGALVTMIAPTHQVNQTAGDAQPQAGSPIFSGGGAICLGERFKQGNQTIFGNSDTGILNREGELTDPLFLHLPIF